MFSITQLIVTIIFIFIINYKYRKYNISSNTTKNSVIILFLLIAIISNLLLSFIPLPYNVVKLVATGEKNEYSSGRPVAVKGMLIDQNEIDANILNGLWNKSGNGYTWYPEGNENSNVISTREITLKVPYGIERELILGSGVNSGIIEVQYENILYNVDLYDKDDIKLKYVSLPSTHIHLMLLIFIYKLIAWLLIIFIFYKIYCYTLSSKFVKILNKKNLIFNTTNILIIVCLISNLILANYVYYAIYNDNFDIITIKALGEKNNLSKDSKITIQNITVSGENIQIEEPITGLWNKSNGKLIWNNNSEIDNITHEIEIKLPRGYDRTINFHNEENSGIVEIQFNNLAQRIDLYNGSHNGVISIPIESNSKLEIHLYTLFKNAIIILISLTMFIFLIKIKKYLILSEIIELDNKALIITLFHFIITFSTDKIYFNASSIMDQIELYLLLKLLFLIALCSFWTFIFKIPKLLSNKETKLFLKISLCYFILICFHILFCWPGTYRGDSSTILTMLKKLELHYWHHYLTSVYYGILLMFIPVVGGLSITQGFIYSLIMGYVTKEFFLLFKYKLKSFLILLVWFLPPIIFYTTFTLRLNAIGFLEVLVIVLTLKLIYKAENTTYNKLIKLSYLILCSVMTNWRSEAFFYCFVVPIFILIWNYDNLTKKYNFSKVTKEFIMYLFLVIIIMIPQKNGMSNSDSERYVLSSVIEPLHYVYNNVENIMSDPLSIKLNEIINVDIFYNSKTGEAAFYNITKGRDTPTSDMYAIVKRTSFKILLKYPTEFIQGRFYWFSKYIFEPYVLEFNSGSEYYSKIYQNFIYTDNIVDIISVNTRAEYIDTLGGSGCFSNIIKHTWSLLIPIVTICLYFIYFLINIKTKWREFLVILIPCFRIAAVFLFSPSARFMYYFPAYLVGWLLFVLAICQLLENIKPQQLQLEGVSVDSIINDEDLLDENETDIKDEDEIESETGEDVEI